MEPLADREMKQGPSTAYTTLNIFGFCLICAYPIAAKSAAVVAWVLLGASSSTSALSPVVCEVEGMSEDPTGVMDPL